MDLAALLTHASNTLQGSIGGAELSEGTVLKESHRSRTIRCVLAAAGRGARSVILKQFKAEAGCFYSDYASLEFLSGIAGTRRLMPQFLGGSIAGEYFVIEDLGPGESLEEILRRGMAEETTEALAGLGVQMARLHNLTLGGAAEFEALRGELPGASQVGRQRDAVTWLQGQSKIEAWWGALDYLPPADLKKCQGTIAETYARPGDWLAFTHPDPAPSNNHFRDGKVRLLDFEYGGYRHALYDATAWEILCPLPEMELATLRASFRDELARSMPLARTEAFDSHWATLCAYRALALLTWITPAILDADQAWVGQYTQRDAVLSAITRLAAGAASYAHLEAVAQMAADIEAILRRQWPEYGVHSPIPAWRGRR